MAIYGNKKAKIVAMAIYGDKKVEGHHGHIW